MSLVSVCKGQEIYLGGGVFSTIENDLPSHYNSRIGLEGIFEVKPFNQGLLISISPNLILKDIHYNVLVSVPAEIKWLFGNKLKIYPSLGYIVRNHSFSGVSTGIGFELELSNDLKAGIKCNRISGAYKPKENLGIIDAHGEISVQFGIYILKKITI